MILKTARLVLKLHCLDNAHKLNEWENERKSIPSTCALWLCSSTWDLHARGDKAVRRYERHL